MIRRPPRSTLSSSSAASDVYKRQVLESSAVLPLGQSEVERAPLKAASVHVTNTQVVTLSRKGRVYCTNLTDEPPAIPAVLKMGGVRVAQVACGENNITMLGTGGEVYSYGEARYSGLGMRAHVQLHKPSLVQDPQLWGQKVRWISCGAAHTVALTAMHQLFTWGSAQGPTGLDQLTPKVLMPEQHAVYRTSAFSLFIGCIARTLARYVYST
eukprot:TRINITY_DN7184_c0_g1_i5.p1 TRINITY_DN7184_c0_g1~~TRINITY_DN7184_c0_g1_i5.p1  ORF type:complete len:212 (+),score=49.95 TRINITY_DN7184_c0_g1_i5:68-703(+)